MKKYVKPDVFIEEFELSSGVASCSGIVFNKDGSVKSWNNQDAGLNNLYEDLGLFDSSCVMVLTKDDYYNYFGQDDGYIFGS